MPGFVPFTREEMDETIPERFARQARLHASRPAIVTRRAARTYAALDRASNQIAHAVLREIGAGAHSVAVLLDSDVEMAEAFLGLLKAGKRYVPIDPGLPRARAAIILADSEARLLLTGGAYLGRAAELASSGVRMVDLGALDPTLPESRPETSVPLDAHTWIVYTSGSSGQPKGLLQTHENLMQYLRTYTNAFRLSPEDRLTSLFTLAVNGGLHDLLISLSTGGCFCPWHPGRDGVAGAGGWLREQGATILSAVPTVFRHVTAALGAAETFPRVRLVRLWGEPSYRRDFEAFRRHFPEGSRLVNRLGSSETGPLRWIFLDRHASFPGNRVPVGWDAPDVQTLLLDDNGRPVPLGEVGEVVARSRYLSPGYWRRPEQTAAAFSVDADDPGLRRYRTGDTGRLLADSNLIPMGRKDHQVKIRGHRVEVDEIEQALLRHPDVREAVVVGAPDAHGEEVRLTGYVVPRSMPPPTVTALHRALAVALPASMIPSAFVFLDALPQAQNGKVNRRALPPPGTGRPDLDAPFRAGAGEVERAVAEIWQDVLGLQAVGVDDPFLELGGDSLQAMQVLARVLAAFRVEIALSALLSAPTVADMARLIAEARQAGRRSPSPPADALEDRLAALPPDEVRRLLEEMD